MDPSHGPRNTFGNWADIETCIPPPLFPVSQNALHEHISSVGADEGDGSSAAQDAIDGAAGDDECDGDEDEVEPSAFSQPSGPWSTLEDMVDSWETAANSCNHRFKLCYTTASHVCVKYIKKADDNADVTSRIPDFGYFYCSCTKQGACSAKPHAKSWCPFKVCSCYRCLISR
jgi:hypothetical protein